MTRILRRFLLVVPLAIGLAAAHVPGGAQTVTGPASGRFAFADTTLLRDTLDLKFDRLFPLADSLGLAPDTLRALAVRYRMSLARMTYLADSLHAPVDSVGVILRREQFNPLSSRVKQVNALQYTSGYNIAQTTSSWTNASDWNLVQGPLFVRNTTSISMERYNAGREVNLQQTRSSTTESGWKFSDNLSLGGRAILDRFDSRDPANNQRDTQNQFQFSTRVQQRFSPRFTNELSFFSGLLDRTNTSLVKRGVTADLLAKSRLLHSTWFVHDVTAHLNGTVAHTRLPTAIQQLTTNDLSDNVDGTLSMWQAALVGLNVKYSLGRTRYETPLDSAKIQQLRTGSDGVTTTLRIRQDNDRYMTIAERLRRSSSVSATDLTSLNTRGDQGFDMDGRYTLLGGFLDGSFDNTYSTSSFPHRSAAGGYLGKSSSRSVRAALTRTFRNRFTLKAEGRVNLTSSRYDTIGVYPNPPVPNDNYRQSWRLEGQYNRSQHLSTGVALEVIRALAVNIPSATTSANNETRTYRAEWRWNCQIMPGFTATQLDKLSADYVRFPFLPVNNRLSLNYGALTTLSAVLTPRTTIEVTHSAQLTPSGNYTVLDDGNEYFSESDEGRNYTLRARVTYQPAPLLSLNVSSEYLANARNTVTNSGAVPQSDNRTLNFSGGGSLNVPLGAKGRLSGDLLRSYQGQRSRTFQNGLLQPAPRTEHNFWSGRLELSWSL